MSLQEMLQHLSPIDSYSLCDIVRQIWSSLQDPALQQHEKQTIEHWVRRHKDSLLNQKELNLWKSSVVTGWKKLVSLICLEKEYYKVPVMPAVEFLKKQSLKLRFNSSRGIISPDVSDLSEEDITPPSNRFYGQGQWECFIHKAETLRDKKNQLKASTTDLTNQKLQLEAQIVDIEKKLEVISQTDAQIDAEMSQLQIDAKTTYERFSELLFVQ